MLALLRFIAVSCKPRAKRVKKIVIQVFHALCGLGENHLRSRIPVNQSFSLCSPLGERLFKPVALNCFDVISCSSRIFSAAPYFFTGPRLIELSCTAYPQQVKKLCCNVASYYVLLISASPPQTGAIYANEAVNSTKIRDRQTERDSET